MLITSTFLTVRPVRLVLLSAVEVMLRVSVPAPPSIVSPLLIVVIAAPLVALTTPAVIVFASPLPAYSSTPVVSELVFSFLNPLFLLVKSSNSSMETQFFSPYVDSFLLRFRLVLMIFIN